MLQWAVKKFPEWWYCTMMVRNTATHTQACSIVGSTDGRLLLDSSELGRRIRFYVLRGCETCPFEDRFQNMEEPKVTRSEILRVRWLGDDRNVFLGEELLHNKRNVTRCVSVMQKPLLLPLVALLPQKCMQNLHV
jgi:hypothetical protein